MVTWHTGQAWRVVNGLNKLDQQIRAYAPRSIPPATNPDSWGALADNAHSTSSDHYPHFYSALGSTAVVCARDFPHAPGLGLSGPVVTEHLRRQRDPRVGYIICAGRITGPNHGWAWDPYDGADPHDTHFHVSSVHGSVADSTAAWSLPGGAVPAPSPIRGDHEMIYTVTGVPAGAVDCLGSPVVNNSRCLATPRGPLGLTGPEAASLPVAYWTTDSVDMAWSRLQVVCDAMRSTVLIDDATREALATAAGQAVKDSLGAGGALEARLTAWANSVDGQAALVAAANAAEDS